MGILKKFNKFISAPKKSRAINALVILIIAAAIPITVIVAQQQQQTQQSAATPAVVANPPLSQACGLDIALVIDRSGSIDATELKQMKAAMTGFVKALKGTPTQFSVTTFNATAKVISKFTSDATSVINTINGIGICGSTEQCATNWQDALLDARGTFDPRPSKPNLIIFTSDGNPTWRNSNGGVCDGWNVCQAGLDAAMTQANLAKNSGTRILAIGIGNGLDVPNLKAISGNKTTGTGLAKDVITSDFTTLANTLATFAKETCGGKITVTKYIDSVSPTTLAGAGYIFNVGGTAGQTDASSQTQAITVAVGSGKSVIETGGVSGYSFSSASCVKKVPNLADVPVGSPIANGVGSITITADDIITCDFINKAVACGSNCTTPADCASAKDGCTTCVSNKCIAPPTPTPTPPVSCGSGCNVPSDCGTATNGCTTCDTTTHTCSKPPVSCGAPCTLPADCASAINGCTTCDTTTHTCSKPPVSCGAPCTLPADCASAINGCTNCDLTVNKCVNTPVCGAACTKTADCTGAKDGCTNCDLTVNKCVNTPVCGAACTKTADCTGAKDGCTNCDLTVNKCVNTPVCGAACTKTADCTGAKDGCTNCDLTVNKCVNTPVCGAACTKTADCTGAKDGCTNCDLTVNKCVTPPACGTACTKDTQCADAKDGCNTCDLTLNKCVTTPACGVSCTANPASCLSAKDGCTACTGGVCAAPFDPAVCKCDGITNTPIISGQNTTITAFAKVSGTDISVAKIASQTFALYENLEGDDAHAIKIMESGPIIATVVSSSATEVKYQSQWTFKVPTLKKGYVYRIGVDIGQAGCKQKTVAYNYSSSQKVVLAASSSFWDSITNFIANLLTSFSNPLTGRKTIQLETFTPPANVYERFCTFIKFKAQ